MLLHRDVSRSDKVSTTRRVRPMSRKTEGLKTNIVLIYYYISSYRIHEFIRIYLHNNREKRLPVFGRSPRERGRARRILLIFYVLRATILYNIIICVCVFRLQEREEYYN